MQQSTVSIPTLNNQGPNLAPPVDQSHQEAPKTCKPFVDWAKELTEKLERQNIEVWRELHLMWLLIALFIEGKHMLRRRHRSFGFEVIPLPDSTAAAVREQNKLGYYSRELSARHVSSRTEIEAIGSDDTDEAQAAARMAEAWLEAIGEEIYTEQFKQRESLGGQACGTYARYFFYDENADGGFTNDAIIQDQPVSFGDDRGQCLECGYEGSATDFGQGNAAGAQPGSGVAQQLAGGMGAGFGGAGGGSPAAAQPGYGTAQGTPTAPFTGGIQRGGGGSPQMGVGAAAGGLNGRTGLGFSGATNSYQANNATGINPGQLPGPQRGIPPTSTGPVDASSGGVAGGPGLPAGIPGPGEMGSSGGSQPTCPQCGSSLVQIDQMPTATVQNVVGYQQRKLGKIVGLSAPYTRIRHEIATSFEDSPWGRYKQRLRIEQIKEIFPGIKVSPTDSKMRDSGLEVEDTLQRTVGGYQNTAMLGYWSKDRTVYSEITHWWFTPAMYHDYVFPEDTETAEGATIPAGTAATDLFPDGMHFVLVTGNDQPLLLENDNHRDHWVTAPYHLRLLSGMGLGINDAVEMQRQWNVVLGLVFTHIRTAALPGWLYDKDTVAPDEVRKLGQPQMSVPASLRNKPEGTRLEQLVYQMQPGQIPSHIPWYIGQLDANMQTISGALINEGVPGADSTTATGVEANVGASQQHNAPEFALKGDADVRSAGILCKLAQRHMPEQRLITLAGKWGQYDVLQFCGADLAVGKFRLQAKRDSWLPNTRMNKQRGMERLLTLTGGIPGLLMLQTSAPELLDQIEEAYDVSLQGSTYSANVIICRQRLDQIKKYAPMFESMTAGMQMQPQVDPATGVVTDPQDMIVNEIMSALRPPVAPEEPGHLLSINYLREWFLTDPGKQASDLERACVKKLIELHIESQILEGQITARAQMAAMPMPGVAAPSAPPSQQQQPKNKPKTEADQRRHSALANVKAMNPNPMPQAPQQPAMAA